MIAKKLFVTVVLVLHAETYRAYQKKMAIRSRGKSRQIAANRGKSRQIAAKSGKFRFKKNGDHFFKKSRPIASQRAFQKTMVAFDPFLLLQIRVPSM